MNAVTESIQEVVIADDDRDDFDILQDVIKSLPLQLIVTQADNGEILMQLIHSRIPDLLFLDLVLPRKDGRACINEIRSNRKFDNMPIIIYTSKRDLESVEFCFRSGTNLYVYKPDTYGGIVDIVQKIFAIDWKKISYYPTMNNYILNPRV
jgi:CheY-like chemotaxis protein